MPNKLWNYSNPKPLRFLGDAVLLPAGESPPTTANEFNELLRGRKLRLDVRRNLVVAWQSGYPVIYDEGYHRFRTRNGLVDPLWLGGQFDDALEKVEREASRLCNDLRERRLAPGEWYAQMSTIIRDSHQAAAWANLGPLALQHPYRLNVEAEIERQLSYLRSMRDEVATGAIKRDGGICRRQAMYVNSARISYGETARNVAELDGLMWEENILGANERHCPGCVQQTNAGRVPIGTLVPIGARTCLSACQCHIMYS